MDEGYWTGKGDVGKCAVKTWISVQLKCVDMRTTYQILALVYSVFDHDYCLVGKL